MADFGLRQILYLTDMISKIVRDNFSDISAWFGDIQNQINLLLTPPAGNEVSNARDFHPILRDRLRSGFQVFPKYMVSGGEVTEDTGLNMKVQVAAGECVIAGIGCVWAGQTSGVIVAPVTDPRWDTVYVDSGNVVAVATGSEDPEPVLPSLSSSQKKLRHIYLTPGMTAITNADMRDARRESSASFPFLGFGDQIGTIDAWDKDFLTTYGLNILDEEHAALDGSVCDDPESPFYRATLRTLSDGRFLKGGATSGSFEASANKSHNHTITDPGHGHNLRGINAGGGSLGVGNFQTPVGGWASSPIHQFDTVTADTIGAADGSLTGISLADEGATDAVPKNMSVVWIMRIK